AAGALVTVCLRSNSASPSSACSRATVVFTPPTCDVYASRARSSFGTRQTLPRRFEVTRVGIEGRLGDHFLFEKLRLSVVILLCQLKLCVRPVSFRRRLVEGRL